MVTDIELHREVGTGRCTPYRAIFPRVQQKAHLMPYLSCDGGTLMRVQGVELEYYFTIHSTSYTAKRR